MSTGSVSRAAIPPAQAAAFLTMLRDARATVYADAESFDRAAAVLEHIGQYLANEIRSGLGHYSTELVAVAASAPGASLRDARQLFETVRRARNDSVHSGAYIRHHVLRLVEFILLLEAAISMTGKTVGDLMVRNPIIAEDWHTVAAARRVMLTNSFSYLPIKTTSGWKLISDVALVWYLRRGSPTAAEERTRLGSPLGGAGLDFTTCTIVSDETLLEAILDLFRTERSPVLVHETGAPDRLLGIITAFDLL